MPPTKHVQTAKNGFLHGPSNEMLEESPENLLKAPTKVQYHSNKIERIYTKTKV